MKNKPCQWKKNIFTNCYEAKICIPKDIFELIRELLTKNNIKFEHFFTYAVKNECIKLLEYTSNKTKAPT